MTPVISLFFLGLANPGTIVQLDEPKITNYANAADTPEASVGLWFPWAAQPGN